MPAIFISYRREDSIAYSGRLYDRLTAEFGKGQVFMDIDSIDPGADFIEVIEQTVAACDAVLVVIGRQWLTAADAQGRRRIENPEDFVRLEVETALSRKVRVVPVLVGGAQMPRSDELPATLGGLLRRHALDLPHTAFHQTLGRLIDSLRRDESRPAVETEAGERVERMKLAREPIQERAEKEGRNRAPRWAAAALAGAALVGGGAVVYFRSHSRPAAPQTNLTAATGVARPAAGSAEAALEKGAPRTGTTMATVAPDKRAAKMDTATATAASITARVPAPAVAPRLPEPPALHTGQTKVNPRDGLRYVWIPPGTFTMGCSPGDSECFDQEKPAHRVAITTGLWLGQTPVTVGAWKRYREATGKPALNTADTLGRKNLNEASGDDAMPAVAMNWDEAKGFCEWAGGRLPTEAEWEYAARAGSTAARYGNLDAIAWYGDNSGKERLDSAEMLRTDAANYGKRLFDNANGPHPVGQKQPNAWNLYDMLGNVSQWTAGWYVVKYPENSETDPRGPASGQNMTLRGGSWGHPPRQVRASDRRLAGPEARTPSFGLRCVGN